MGRKNGMEKRFVLFYPMESENEWQWFKTEEEMRDFLSFYETDGIRMAKAIEILNIREIDLTD